MEWGGGGGGGVQPDKSAITKMNVYKFEVKIIKTCNSKKKIFFSLD